MIMPTYLLVHAEQCFGRDDPNLEVTMCNKDLMNHFPSHEPSPDLSSRGSLLLLIACRRTNLKL